jgi:hypothetical protein
MLIQIFSVSVFLKLFSTWFTCKVSDMALDFSILKKGLNFYANTSLWELQNAPPCANFVRDFTAIVDFYTL